jgi:hypothetical protein
MDENEKKNEAEDEITVSGFVDRLLDATVEVLMDGDACIDTSKVEERMNLTRLGVVEMLLAKRILIRLYDSQGVRCVDGVLRMAFLERPGLLNSMVFRGFQEFSGLREPAPKQPPLKPKKKTRPPWA